MIKALSTFRQSVYLGQEEKTTLQKLNDLCLVEHRSQLMNCIASHSYEVPSM
jgi:hypothetical protein